MANKNKKTDNATAALLAQLRSNDDLTELNVREESLVQQERDDALLDRLLEALRQNDKSIAAVRYVGPKQKWDYSSHRSAMLGMEQRVELFMALSAHHALRKLVLTKKALVPLELLTHVLSMSRDNQLEHLELTDDCDLGPFSNAAFVLFCKVVENHRSLRTFKFSPSVSTRVVYDEMGFNEEYLTYFDLDKILLAVAKNQSLQVAHIFPRRDSSFHRKREYSVDSLQALCESSNLQELVIDLRDDFVIRQSDNNTENLTRALIQSTTLRSFQYCDDGSRRG